MTELKSVSYKEHLAASGSPKNEVAIRYVAEMHKVLQELLDGQYPEDIQSFTGLPIERCEEIYRMRNTDWKKINIEEEASDD